MIDKENKKSVYIRYYLYSIFTSTSLIVPIRVAYMIAFGITTPQISLMKSVFSIIVFLFEIPTGILADKYGNRKSVVLGSILFSIHSLFYILFPNFWGFILTQIILGFANSFISGADSSYLHTYHELNNKSVNFQSIFSKLRAFTRPVSLFFSVVSSILFAFNPKLNFFLTFLLGLLAAVVFISLPEENNNRFNQHTHTSEITTLGFKFFRSDKSIILDVVAFAMLTGILIANFELYQVLFSMAKIPIELYGAIYASFSILAMIGDLLSNKITQYLNFRRSFGIFFLLISFGFILIVSKNVIFVLGSIIIQQLVFASSSIIFETQLLKKVGVNATAKTSILSVSFTIISLIKIFLMSSIAFLLTKLKLDNAYYILASLSLILGVIVLLVGKTKK